MKRFIRILILFIALVPLGFTTYGVTISETHVNVICNGGNNGSIDITPSGGTAPYTYLWTGGDTFQDRTNLTAGPYFVLVTDNIGDTATLLLNITEPPAMTFSKALTHVYCGGDSTGSIDLTVTGGTPGYTYVWSDGPTTEDRVNITAANRYFTVTDASGCTKFDSANVIQPPGMVISDVTTDQTCSGSDGSIDLTVQFGIPGYSYLWNDGDTSQDRTGVAAGTYTVTITDNSTCTVSASVTVGLIISSMTINGTVVQPSCFGGNNGTITITSVIGSVGPYTFQWSDGPVTQNRTGLSAGTYIVTATSSTGCTATSSIPVIQPTVLTVSLVAIPVSCNGGNNGAINTTRSGGTSPYSYAWSDGGFTQNRTGLAAGSYTLTVTDFRGCTATATVSVSQPALALTVIAIPSPLACIGGASGSVMSTVTGGTAPYNYWWGGAVISQNRINVASGTYCVTATDANGCTANACAVIPPYTPLGASTTQVDITCTNDSTGSVNLTVTNGSTPYVYLWNTGAITEDISNLSTGTYAVTVTDANTCTFSQSVSITGPSFPLSVNTTVADISCYGNADGSIMLSVSNGTAPYTYSWNGGATTQDRTGLLAGSYSVTITDNNGCTVSTGATVTEPTQLVVSASATNVACYGDSSGTISLTATGSFAPYAYTWNDGGNTQNRTNLPAGNYTVSLLDNHGCTASASAVVSQPAAPVVITATTGDVSCSGATTGWININVTGGTSPYTFDWGGAITTQNRTNLSAGTYVVTVLDNAGCSYTSSSTINAVSSILITSAVTNVACNGGNTGTINLTVSGGTSPYTFDWGGAITTQNRTNLPSGVYTVIVTDFTGCSNTHTATISQSTTLTVSSVSTNVSCNAANTGTITVTVTGGTVPYDFIWNDFLTTQNRTGIAAGNYSVTVSDANSCTASASSVINEPSPIVLSTTAISPVCFGLATGSIDLTVSGGTGAYLYSWSNSSNTQDINSVAAGTYLVNVADANNCAASTSAIITEPAQIILSTTQVNIGCSGGTGSIDLTVSGGISPFIYNWSTSEITEDISSLAAGSYSVTVNDATSCSATTDLTITQASPLVISEMHTNISCFGMNDGTITIDDVVGVAPYTFDWGGSISTQNRTNLSAGVYTLTVTDNTTCSGSISVTIIEPTALVASITKTDAVCNGTTGSIDLTVSGGTTAYSYLWDNNTTNEDLPAVTAGTYSVVVNDANSCTATASATVDEPIGIQISLSKANVTCFSLGDGTITATIFGGNTYLWSNGAVTPNLNNLPPATYTLTVTDLTGCTASSSININEPTAVAVTETHTNVSCNGGNNGSITTTPSGGVGGFTFVWSNTEVTQDISNLSPNSYTVTVADANSCSASTTVIITESPVLTLSETNIPYACSNSMGSIDLTVTGGTSPYNYNWAHGAVTEDLNNITGGTYSVIVTDANACSVSAVIGITALTPLTSFVTTIDLVCNGTNNGSIDLTVNGGTAPYTYAWTSTAIIEDLNGLAAGNYAVVITDANNCSTTNATTLSQPGSISVSNTVVHVKCFGDTNGAINISVNGGTTPYNFTWSNSSVTEDISAVPAASYSVTITDQNGCNTSSTNMNVLQPAILNMASIVTPVSCLGRSNGEIDLQVSGGTTPYTFNWNNQLTSSNISNLATGNYVATVTDVNGCSASATESIGLVTQIIVSAAAKNTACEQVATGVIDLTVNGGTPPFIFIWNNGDNTEDIHQLATGSYAVSVIDSRDCSVQGNFNIGADYDLQADATASAEINLGESIQLTVTTNVDHGNMYAWTPEKDLLCAACATTLATPNITTRFNIVVTDTNGCKASDELTLIVNSITDIFIPNAFTPNNDGSNDVLELYGDKGSITFLSFMLFNRWGEKVLESADPNFKWDGTYQGEAVAPGVYVYVMKAVFINGYSRNDYKGSVTVLR